MSSNVEFKKEDFHLDFNSAVSSDKSTTDNFLSDEELHLKLRQRKINQLKKKSNQPVVELEQQAARNSANDGKFYWYWPQMF
jgi:hypothetical protein